MKLQYDKRRKHALLTSPSVSADYQSLFEGLPIGLYRTTPQGQFIDVNRAFAQVLGYADKGPLLALPAAELYLNPEDRRRWQLIIERQGVVRDFEVPLRRSDGSTVWIKETARAVSDSEGRVLFYEGALEDITQRKLAEEALYLDSQIMTHMAEGVYLIRASDGIIVHANRQIEQMFGYLSGELIGKHVSVVNAPTDKPPEETAKEIIKALNQYGMWKGEILNIKKDGTSFWCHASVSTFTHSYHGTIWVSVHQDVTERKRAEEQLYLSAEILQKVNTLIFVAGSQGEIVYVSPYVKMVLGYEPSELLGDGWWNLTWGDPAERERQKQYIARCARGEIPVRDAPFEREVRTRDGQSHWLLWQDSKGPDGLLIGVAQDLTERKRFEAQLVFLANHDMLTGLFNRHYFHEELQRQLAYAVRYSQPGALLWLDLDRFKEINDSLGHRAGDEFLIQLTVSLRDQLRESDVLARLGGDEFAIILPNVDATQAQATAVRLLQEIHRHCTTIEGQRLRITCSIGLVLFPHDGATPEELLARADLAMYLAKEEGRNSVHLYKLDSSAQLQLKNSISWVRRISEALDQNRFLFYVQPIFDLKQDKVSQYELLLRLPGRGSELVGPGAFLDIAMRYGLMRDIDRWVVRHAIQFLGQARSANRSLGVHINLSAHAFGDSELLCIIERELSTNGVDPASLVLEISENAAISHLQQTWQFIEVVRRLGCRCALDDFGVGLSSFSYLKNLPVDYLKIDGSFIENLCHDPVDQHLVQAMIHAAELLGKKTIAEFVGDAETLRLLRTYGLNYAQGHYIGQPRPAQEAFPSG